MRRRPPLQTLIRSRRNPLLVLARHRHVGYAMARKCSILNRPGSSGEGVSVSQTRYMSGMQA